MRTDFARAKAELQGDLLGLCRHYLPNGKRSGNWWLAAVPWRVDRHPSLGVHLQSGNWKDFASPDEKGDILDLIARIEGMKPADVVRRLLA
jgi:hypothetical protein